MVKGFISSLANEVLDDLDRAMLSAQEEHSFQNLKEGLEMIQKKLFTTSPEFLGWRFWILRERLFDPSYQEALSPCKKALNFRRDMLQKPLKKPISFMIRS